MDRVLQPPAHTLMYEPACVAKRQCVGMASLLVPLDRGTEKNLRTSTRQSRTRPVIFYSEPAHVSFSLLFHPAAPFVSDFFFLFLFFFFLLLIAIDAALSLLLRRFIIDYLIVIIVIGQ